jgi:hypothetical protein
MVSEIGYFAVLAGINREILYRMVIEEDFGLGSKRKH